MPNHCHNDLWLLGSPDEVAKILQHIGALAEEPRFDFSTVIPYPEPWAEMDADMDALMALPKEEQKRRNAELRNKWDQVGLKRFRDGFNSGGHEWCRKEWGTKWSAYRMARRDYEGTVCLTFQTAWAPPRPVAVALSKMFDITLSLEWFEPSGCQNSCGGFTCYNSIDATEMGREYEPHTIVRAWEAKYTGRRGG